MQLRCRCSVHGWRWTQIHRPLHKRGTTGKPNSTYPGYRTSTGCLYVLTNAKAILNGRFAFFFLQYIEMGQCYRLRTVHVEQQRQEVIDHFSLYGAYNHCDRCRGDDFLMASQNDMREMFNSYRGDPSAGSSSWHRQQQFDRSQKQWKCSYVQRFFYTCRH